MRSCAVVCVCILPAGYIGMLNKGCVERLWSRLYPSQPHISGTVLVNTDLDSFPF